MSGITLTSKGDFKHTEKFLNKMKDQDYSRVLDKYGKIGAQELAKATPVDSGKTASSWNYEIEVGRGSSFIYWTNSNINKNVNIAIILQYGHGTGTGGYVQGRDYINPVMRSLFDKLAEELWKEITSI